MNKLGDKIKEIRLKEGLSQDAFAKELGYTSRSTINKIEKGINEISYEKLMLILEKYDLELNQLFEMNQKESSFIGDGDSILYINFSGWEDDCEDVVKYLMYSKDKLIYFKNINYNNCSNCNYECFYSQCKYRFDDVYNLIDSIKTYSKVVFIVPMYYGNASSLYYIFNERMQDYFNSNQNKWDEFINKLHFILICNSDKKNPYYINCFKSLVDNETQILKLDCHKYNMSDKIDSNKSLVTILDQFKEKLKK